MTPRGPLELPPINALVVFEAAGAHANFTAAAKELGVTREAVSMQVRLLEAELGVRLFNRQQRGVVLTKAGKILHADISLALRKISETCANVRADNENSVVVTTSVAFGSCWLLPRILDFQKRNPGIKIRLIETDECIDLLHHEIDFGIRYGKGKWGHLKSVRLFQEEFFPVCTREYSEALRIDTIGSLQNATFLHLAGGAHAWEDWKTWFELAQAQITMPNGGLWFNNYDNLLKAALNSQGVALGWTRLVEDYISDGSLVSPVDLRFHTGNGYYLVEASKSNNSAARHAFQEWIFSFASPNL